VSWDISVIKVTGHRLNNQGLISNMETFLFTTMSRQTVQAIQPPIQWIVVEKWQKCKAKHSPPLYCIPSELSVWTQ